ncbi:hypothetical protein Psi02_08320 [Planotetraspora silvatica]|uniref:Uncharacterized protein n=1 Tax=Planotetraspora silvatica TaxID=234614 RepID=A0A8J3UFN2_9ACTN|nr:hypothetical protein Psi02_08320 [Planotetraspora silvatica]
MKDAETVEDDDPGRRLMETSPPGEQYLLITSKDRPLPSVVILCLAVAVLAGGYLALRWVSQQIHGLALGLTYAAGGLLLLLVFWVVGAHVELLMNWAYWRRRGVPANAADSHRPGLQRRLHRHVSAPRSVGPGRGLRLPAE